MVLGLFNRDRQYKPGQMIEDYTVLQVIGEGKFGICYLVSQKGTKYILKQLKQNILKKIGSKANFEEEILKKINHERIPMFLNKVESLKFVSYILEYKAGKTFEEIVFEDNHVFTRDEIYDIGKQLISILRYLHGKAIVHRDIRLPNALYNDGKVYLVDFGLARWQTDKYKFDLDFSYLGDFLLHLYYTSFKGGGKKDRPWYEELKLTEKEGAILKRMMGIEKRYRDIDELEKDFFGIC